MRAPTPELASLSASLLELPIALAAFALLFLGGEWLVRGASDLARRLGIGELAIGLTIVAFGTSAPELVVSIDAAHGGADAIAIGNVVGSNIANIALILGACALMRPLGVHLALIRRELPLLILVSIGAALLFLDDVASRPDGALLLGGLAIYLGWTLRAARRAGRAAEIDPPRPAGWVAIFARILLGLGALLAGAPLLVKSAVELAQRAGVSEAVIGLTLVAVGTSLPELATSLAATRRGNGDLAIGNVVGSNLFNLLGILGASALVAPLERSGVRWIDLGAMCAVAVLLWPLLRSGHSLSRREGALLLLSYGVLMATLQRA